MATTRRESVRQWLLEDPPLERKRGTVRQWLLEDRLTGDSAAAPSRPVKKPQLAKNPWKSVERKKPMGFLDLPAEVRNIIYEFADCKPEWSQPVLTRRSDQGPYSVSPQLTSRAFLGLAQTCKLIRNEYLPLWLHRCEVTVNWTELNDFLDAFYPDVAISLSGPQQLGIRVVEAPSGPIPLVEMDMKRLWQFRAHQISTNISFTAVEYEHSGLERPGDDTHVWFDLENLNKFFRLNNEQWLHDVRHSIDFI